MKTFKEAEIDITLWDKCDVIVTSCANTTPTPTHEPCHDECETFDSECQIEDTF